MLREQPAKRAACQHFFFLKKVCLMYVSIAFLAPGELLLSCLAGFLTQPFRKAAFPSFRIVAWRLLSSSIWLYSSGHCSGFSPDSLLYNCRMAVISPKRGQRYIFI